VARKPSAAIQEQVRRRANYACEYCHTSEHWQAVRFTIDHVVPVIEGGEDTLENLALACFHCNRRKSDMQTASDADTGQIVPLFNPREHHWADHFIWSADGLRVIPGTAIGRATLDLLELNRERILFIRSADVSIGRHPPADDPIQQLDNA
jgi:hypothetical protein